MKILLINNDSDTWSKLVTVAEATGHEVDPIHHSAIGAIDARAYDVAILSGGWWADYQEIPEILVLYAEELQFIKSAPIPIVGICVGMQLQHVATNQAVPLMDEPQSGDKPITINERGQKLFGLPPELEVFKNHTRAIFETDPQFEILATSSTTPKFTEIMIHRQKPLLGVQFHPEMGPVDAAAGRLNALINGLLDTEQAKALKAQ